MDVFSESISVVLATYNGERHLGEQLASLRSQSVFPKKLVICDDGSSDSTMHIIHEFCRTAPFPVEVYENEINLLPTENFFKAVEKCDTVYVAFCDQDDIWMPEKIEKCQHAINIYRPDVILHSFIDFRVDENGKKIVTNRYMVRNTSCQATKIAPDVIWLGMAMVVKRDLIQEKTKRQSAWLPHFEKLKAEGNESNQSHWHECHDTFLLYRAKEAGTIGLIADVLVEHRTFSYGFHSDPTRNFDGSENFKPVKTRPSNQKSYEVLSRFCEEFSFFIDEIGSSQKSKEYYDRWKILFRNRSTLHSKNSRIPRKIECFCKIAFDGGYRGKWNGGFGLKSAIKDAAAVVGVGLG